MSDQPLTQFQFRSIAFNCTEPREYFINDCCFGDDVAEWLTGALKHRGVSVAPKIAEDWGWIVPLNWENADYFIGIGFQPNDETTGDRWLGWVEKRVGMLKSLFTRKEKTNIPPELWQLVDSILRSREDISGVTWSPSGVDPEFS